MKKILILTLFITFSIELFSFEIKDNRIYDSRGNSIEIKEYKRIAIIAPAAIETIFLLNGGDSILGIGKNVRSPIWPQEETDKLPSIGNTNNPSFEQVLSMEADLMILNNAALRTTELLNKIDIPYIIHDTPNDIDSILESIKIYGKLLNREKEAEIIYEDSLAILEKIKIKTAENPLNLNGLILFSSSPLVSFSGDYLPGKILTALGVDNISGDVTGNMPVLSQEHLLESDVDVIIVSQNMGTIQEILRSNPILAETRAGREQNIMTFNTIDFLRGSPRVFSAMEILYEELEKISRTKQ